MKKIKLGVNIDHVATIRNARGEEYPDPYKAALIAKKSGADSITLHLREDRRHIIDNDLKNIKKKINMPINLEMAPTSEMLKIALKYRPNYVCIVPEKRKEITTEGGLNLKKNYKNLKRIINLLRKKKIRVTLFIDSNISDVVLAKKLNSNCVELHTGVFCNLFNKKKNTKYVLKKIKKAALTAKSIGLEVHAGHGLTYESVKPICKIKEITELNIGHSIIADSIFIGLKKSIKKFKQLMIR